MQKQGLVLFLLTLSIFITGLAAVRPCTNQPYNRIILLTGYYHGPVGNLVRLDTNNTVFGQTGLNLTSQEMNNFERSFSIFVQQRFGLNVSSANNVTSSSNGGSGGSTDNSNNNSSLSVFKFAFNESFYTIQFITGGNKFHCGSVRAGGLSVQVNSSNVTYMGSYAREFLDLNISSNSNSSSNSSSNNPEYYPLMSYEKDEIMGGFYILNSGPNSSRIIQFRSVVPLTFHDNGLYSTRLKVFTPKWGVGYADIVGFARFMRTDNITNDTTAENTTAPYYKNFTDSPIGPILNSSNVPTNITNMILMVEEKVIFTWTNSSLSEGNGSGGTGGSGGNGGNGGSGGSGGNGGSGGSGGSGGNGGNGGNGGSGGSGGSGGNGSSGDGFCF